MGKTVETAVCGHLFSHSRSTQSKFSYWKDPNDKEVDLIYQAPEYLLPFEVKYIEKQTTVRDVQGLMNFCRSRSVSTGFILTKEHKDIGPVLNSNGLSKIMRIPTSIFCYWLGQSEISQKNLLT